MHINIQYNQTIVDESEEIVKLLRNNKEASPFTFVEPLVKNVVVLYLDAVGRRQAHNKIPKTIKYLAERTKK